MRPARRHAASATMALESALPALPARPPVRPHARRPRPHARMRRRRAVLGRTQYTLADAGGRAHAGMKSLRPLRTHKHTHTHASAPAPAPAPPARADHLAPFAPHAPAPTHAPALAPATVEGMGRIVVHRGLLGTPAPPCVQPPPPPPAEAAARHRAVARWLAGDEDDTHESAPPPPPTDLLHPMVAKALRERSRRSRLPHAHTRDLWIASDGRRVCRRAPLRTTRVACTMRTLAESGITPALGCRCGFRDEHMDLVQCDGCRLWLHLACVGVSSVHQFGDGEWLCDDCHEATSALGRLPPAAAAPRRGGLSTTLALAPPTPERRSGVRTHARTPSPPPLDLAFSTPSRARARPAMWTPSQLSVGTPCSAVRIDTPLDLWTTPQRALLGRNTDDDESPWPESPVLATRAGAGGGTEPWSSPPPLCAHDSSSLMSSSPFPATPTGPREHRSAQAGYVMNMRMNSADEGSDDDGDDDDDDHPHHHHHPHHPRKHTGAALLPPLAADGIV